ncbi:hypothetical protein E2C01_077458 [Portunus trituberculatus]|uniref:Uncharacterized protein n=1 Tax=Portunus trituberculatus TaxID=210409 RepID=A0A5B7IMC3_PORTR|nr:hypothetical protein [Portunus trituberculatus]
MLPILGQKSKDWSREDELNCSALLSESPGVMMAVCGAACNALRNGWLIIILCRSSLLDYRGDEQRDHHVHSHPDEERELTLHHIITTLSPLSAPRDATS